MPIWGYRAAASESRDKWQEVAILQLLRILITRPLQALSSPHPTPTLVYTIPENGGNQQADRTFVRDCARIMDR